MSAAEQDASKYTWKTKTCPKNHSFLFPPDIRAIIIGKSGCGKTTLLIHLLLEPDLLDYDTLTVCGNSLHQPEYRVIDAAFNKKFSKGQVRTLFEHQKAVSEMGGVERVLDRYDGPLKGGIDAKFVTDSASLPDPSEHDASCKNLLVLDDIMLGPQNKAEAYYTRGRPNNVDTIYIA